MLINQKWLADGSVLKKIERFSKQDVERFFCKNDEKIAKVNSRLNRDNDPQNWLSMRLDASDYYRDKEFGTYFGEFNENNEAHGRCIEIYNSGGIRIGYFENDDYAIGNYIQIYSDGLFAVGE